MGKLSSDTIVNSQRALTCLKGLDRVSILAPFLYNIYTKSLLDRIKKMEVGTILPGGVNKTNNRIRWWHHINEPNTEPITNYGWRMHQIWKGTFDKIQRSVISGKSPLENPFLTMESLKVSSKPEMKHLGFNTFAAELFFMRDTNCREKNPAKPFAAERFFISR